MRALLLYVQSTHARDITTDSISNTDWNTVVFPKKMARPEGPNIQFIKPVRFEKFDEYWTEISHVCQYT